MSVKICNGTDTTGDSYRPCTDQTVTYEGAVLGTYERNGYDDSDFFAVVWDDADQAVKTVEYASTRGWTYHNTANVDATDEAKAKARAFYVPQFAQARADAINAEAERPATGKRVKVVKGRKVAKDTEGVVFWTGPDKYAKGSLWSSPPERIGFKDDDGATWWTSAANVEVVGAETVTADDVADQVNADGIDFTTAARSLVYSALANA